MRITTTKALLAVVLAAGVSLLLSGNRLDRIVWADGGGMGGMDMGGGGDGDVGPSAGLQMTYAAFPGEFFPGESFTAVLVITNGSKPLSAALTLLYEYVTDDPTQLDIGTAMVMPFLPGVYGAELELKYAGLYRLTYTFVANDATTTHTVIQVVGDPHVELADAAGEEVHVALHNFNELIESAGQKLEFEIEAADPDAVAAEITVYIQDQSGLLDLGTRVLTPGADGHYETPADIDLSGGAPRWDITIETVNYGTKTFTIKLPN